MKHNATQKNLTNKKNRIPFFPLDLFDDKKNETKKNKLSLVYTLERNASLGLYENTGTYFVSCADTLLQVVHTSEITQWGASFPRVATCHSDHILRLFNIETKQKLATELPKDMQCEGIIVHNDFLIVLTKDKILKFSHELALLKVLPFEDANGPHILKLFNNILLWSKNGRLRLYQVLTEQKLLDVSSKDDSYFLHAAVADGQVVAVTATALNVWSFVDEESKIGRIKKQLLASSVPQHAILPTKSPVSCVLLEKGRIIAGAFDGIVSVYDAKHFTKLWEINSQNSSPRESSSPTSSISDSSDRESFVVSNFVTALSVFADFIVIATRSGKCGVWSITDKFQHDPIISLNLTEDSFVSQIMSDFQYANPGNNGKKLYFLEKKGKKHVGMCFWKPNLAKLNSQHSDRILSQMVSKPKGKKSIIQQWIESNKNGMKDEEFINYIQKQVQDEYPWLEDVCESCTITNNLLPDNPIVFVSDEFSEMTGYARSDIIGRNCRFLQGKFTDFETVRKISEAVKLGVKVSVEILNYRKDGAPFWNVFTILPVHDKKGATCAFLAIQKDISMIKLRDVPPSAWRSEEVAMWLESVGLDAYSQLLLAHQMNGEKLMSVSMEDLCDMGVSKDDSKALLAKIASLRLSMTQPTETDNNTSTINNTTNTITSTSGNTTTVARLISSTSLPAMKHIVQVSS